MKRFQNILVSYGDEVGGADALAQASELAKTNNAHLTIATVLQSKNFTANRVEETEKRLLRLASSIREKGVPTVETKILAGHPASELKRQVTLANHDLVIASSESEKHFADIIFGSTVEQLIRNCPCPVWLNKPGQKLARPKVLAAVEGTPYESRRKLDKQILEMAASLAQHHGGNLSIVSAWDVGPEDAETVRSGIAPAHYQEIMDRHQHAHGVRLNSLLTEVALNDKHCQIHLTTKRPSVAVSEFTRREGIDVVIMGAPARRWLFGTQNKPAAEFVLPMIKCGLIAVKPAAETGIAGLSSSTDGIQHQKSFAATSSKAA